MTGRGAADLRQIAVAADPYLMLEALFAGPALDLRLLEAFANLDPDGQRENLWVHT